MTVLFPKMQITPLCFKCFQTFNYFLLIVFFLIFSGCLKKGDDDPAISLKTRKARISGEWILVAGEDKTKYLGDTETWSYLESKVKLTVNSAYIGEISLYKTLEITKDGTYSISTLIDSDVYMHSGIWYFTDKNKELETKNKEIIIFVTDTMKAPNLTATRKGLNSSDTYYIERLSSKELAISMVYSYQDANGKTVDRSEYWKYKKKPKK